MTHIFSPKGELLLTYSEGDLLVDMLVSVTLLYHGYKYADCIIEYS
jgi:hypothetical protein